MKCSYKLGRPLRGRRERMKYLECWLRCINPLLIPSSVAVPANERSREERRKEERQEVYKTDKEGKSTAISVGKVLNDWDNCPVQGMIIRDNTHLLVFLSYNKKMSRHTLIADWLSSKCIGSRGSILFPPLIR